MSDDAATAIETTSDSPMPADNVGEKLSGTTDASSLPSNSSDDGVDDGKALEASEGDKAQADDSKATTVLAEAAPSPPLTAVEKMEVQINFEVGRVSLPVSALANIATGAVVEIPSVSMEKVVAKSGEQAFALGEFVELGGRVGFRITKLVRNSDKN